MGVEQGSLSPKQGLENIHGYMLDASKVPYRDCLSGILALGKVKDQPAVAAFLEVVAASQIGYQVMSDLVVSDAILSVVPDHQKTKAEMAELLQVATILPLDREEKYKPYLDEFREKYPPEPIEPVSPTAQPAAAEKRGRFEQMQAATDFLIKYFEMRRTGKPPVDTGEDSVLVEELRRLHNTLDSEPWTVVKEGLIREWHRSLEMARLHPPSEKKVNGPSIPEVLEGLEKEAGANPTESGNHEGSPEGVTGAEGEVKNLLQQRMQLSGFKEGEAKEESQERFKKILLIENQLREAIVGKEISEARSEAQEEFHKIQATTLSPYRQSSLLDDPQQAVLLERLFQADSPEWAAAFSHYLEKYRLWTEGGRLFAGELEHQEAEVFGDFYDQRHSAFYRCQDGRLAREYNRVKGPNWYLVNAAEPDFWEKAQAGQFQTIDEMREKLKGILESQVRELQLGIRQEEYLSEFYAILAQKAGLRIIPGQDNNRYAGLAEERLS